MSTYRNFKIEGVDEDFNNIEVNIWHKAGKVGIPLWCWDLIIEYLKDVDFEEGEFIDDYSVGYGDDELIDISSEQTIEFVNILSKAKEGLKSSDSIYTLFKDKVYDEEMEEYEDGNHEYICMIEALIQLYKRSLNAKKPICAYNHKNSITWSAVPLKEFGIKSTWAEWEEAE